MIHDETIQRRFGGGTYDVAFAFVKSGFLHSLQSILRIQVGLAGAQVHFGEITSTQESPNHEFFLQVQQDDELFHPSYPLISHFHRVYVEVYGSSLGHDYEAVEIFRRGVFEVVLFEPTILDLENSSLLCISLTL